MNFKLIANCKQYLFDKETPISIYLKVREHFNQCILLENSERSIEKNHFSYICFDPIAGISVTGLNLEKNYPGKANEKTKLDFATAVLPEVVSFFKSFSITALPEGIEYPGLFGYFGYDSIRYFENIQIDSSTDVSIPDIKYDLYRYVLIIDHHKSEMTLVTLRSEDEQSTNFAAIESILNNFNVASYPFKTTSKETSNCTDDEYLATVEKGKAHCYRGDVFQVVLSRSFQINFKGDNFNVYRALRAINSSPYLFYFDYNSFHLFGSSPEAQIKITPDKATIYPIAGTYRRTGDTQKDQLLSAELINDKKENAEHIMLVDLARNDLSKHFAQVKVAEYRSVQYFSHVIHLVSKVEGAQLLDASHPLKILADTFPAGTLTGAPKHKAMTIIDQLEPTQRGFYGGCIGFAGFDGTLNKAIMIRSFLSKSNTLHYQAGAGITVSSVPANELQEINNKINALRNAIEIANTL